MRILISTTTTLILILTLTSSDAFADDPPDPRSSAPGVVDAAVMADLAQLKSGEVVFDALEANGGLVVFEARAVVDATPEEVWPIVAACGDYHTFMPMVAESKEVSRKGDVVVCSALADLPFPMPNRRSVVQSTEVKTPPTYGRSWVFLEGDYTHNEGFWKVAPFEGGKSLVTYRVKADLGFPIPRSLAERGQRGYVIDTFAGLRKRVETSRRAPETP